MITNDPQKFQPADGNKFCDRNRDTIFLNFLS